MSTPAIEGISAKPIGNTRRMIRQTLTIARRDFTATVFTPTFLIFLLAPLIMGSFGAIGGLGAASVAQGSSAKSRIVAIMPEAQAATMTAVDVRLRRVFRRGDAPPDFRVEAPTRDVQRQARDAFATKDYDVSAVLYGPLNAPTILYGAEGARTADYLAELAEDTLRVSQGGGEMTISNATKLPIMHERPSIGGKSQAGFLAAFGIFFLTILLAGQAVGTMAEERGNKVIEVLAAAVPLESVFLGKLLGMFGSAVLFILFWGTLISQIGMLAPAGFSAGLAQLTPPMGLPLFAVLFFSYFTMAYMLLGAVFLSVGAQASSIREIQLLSLPITIFQVAMFGWASVASRGASAITTAAEVFPFSSPYAMAAHAANSPEIWPHIAALAWQLMWVAIVITIGARAFRRGVLQSGSGKLNFRALVGRA